MPFSTAYSLACVSVSRPSVPKNRTSPPARLIASTFVVEVPSGTKITPFVSSFDMAKATAAPWLPLEAATQPAARCFGVNESSLLNAPRSLNEPVNWRFSSFRKTFAPVRSLKNEERSRGVSRICGAMRFAARTTFAGNNSCLIRPLYPSAQAK